VKRANHGALETTDFVYRVDGDELRVLAVAHGRREPAY